MAHHYHITTEGKFINYPQLVADITSHPRIAAVLVNEDDDDMKDKVRWSLKASNLHADAKGRQAFMEDGLNHVNGQTSLCYWPIGCTVERLCDEVKKVRHEQQMSQMQLPFKLSAGIVGL